MLGIEVSNIEALAELFDYGWTSVQYKKNRKKSKKCNALRHPSWHKIVEAKKQCTPEGIESDDSAVWVSMQNALNHQTKKITKDRTLVKQMEDLARGKNISFEMDVKFGSDGSSQFAPARNSTVDDTSLFASNCVPLFIAAIDNDTGESVNVWSNRFANSALGVMPLRWAFEKETTGRFSLFSQVFVCVFVSFSDKRYE